MKLAVAVALIAAFAVPARCQNSTPSNPSADAPATAPAVLLGQSSAARLLGEQPPNYMAGGIAISQMFSDNVELATANQISDLSYDIMPHFTISSSTTRLTYSAGVAAGFLVNRTLSDRNQASQSASLDISGRPSQFVTLRVSDRFMNTTGLWSDAGAANNSAGPGLGELQQPNTSLLTYGKFRANSVLAELTAQLAAGSFAGVRATQSYLWFPSGASDPVLGPLYGGNSYSAEAFFNRRFTDRNWGGIAVRAQRFDVNRLVGATDAASLLFLYAVNIRPNTSVSFFGGPELSVTSVPQGLPVPPPAFQRRLWSPVAGAVFSWQGRRTSAMASFDRQISNGGGLFAAVTLSSAEGQILRQVGRRFEIGPGFAFAQNVPIVTSPTIRSYSGQVQAAYHISNYSLSGGYARDNRSAPDINSSASANRVWVAFSLDFVRPLGR